MKMLGRDPGELRLPMTPLEDTGMVKLKKSLSDYGLL
jgi:4-hydroxy-tetrahydrodipicolinate synthase